MFNWYNKKKQIQHIYQRLKINVGVCNNSGFTKNRHKKKPKTIVGLQTAYILNIKFRQSHGNFFENEPLVLTYMIRLLRTINKQWLYQDVILWWAFGYVGWMTKFNMNRKPTHLPWCRLQLQLHNTIVLVTKIFLIDAIKKTVLLSNHIQYVKRNWTKLITDTSY